MAKQTPAAEAAPHSWDLEHWPETVYPHTPSRARYVLRAHRDELLAAGALVRIGREFVLFGGPYTRWLQSQTATVGNFQIALNRSRNSRAREQPPAP